MKEFEYFPRARRSLGARASKSITGFNHRPTFRGRFIKTIRPIPSSHAALPPSPFSLRPSLPPPLPPLTPPQRQRRAREPTAATSFPPPSPPSSLPSSTSSRRLGLLSRWNSRLEENGTVARNNGRRKRGYGLGVNDSRTRRGGGQEEPRRRRRAA